MKRLLAILFFLALPASAAQVLTMTTEQKIVLTFPAPVTVTSIQPRWQFQKCWDTSLVLAGDGKSVTVNSGLTPCMDFLTLYFIGTVSGVEKNIAKNFWVEIVDEKGAQATITVGSAVAK